MYVAAVAVRMVLCCVVGKMQRQVCVSRLGVASGGICIFWNGSHAMTLQCGPDFDDDGLA